MWEIPGVSNARFSLVEFTPFPASHWPQGPQQWGQQPWRLGTGRSVVILMLYYPPLVVRDLRVSSTFLSLIGQSFIIPSLWLADGLWCMSVAHHGAQGDTLAPTTQPMSGKWHKIIHRLDNRKICLCCDQCSFLFHKYASFVKRISHQGESKGGWNWLSLNIEVLY